jgi:hypothetical protein
MTEWNRLVRHIPDDELHAYLDQALSRSQAVEIERHLARCATCQAGRDAIAALRDRTTDILAGLGTPPRIVPPPYATLVARQGSLRGRRGRWAGRALLAAGLAGVLVAGHGAWPPAPNDAGGPPAQPEVAALPQAPAPSRESVAPLPSAAAAASRRVATPRPPAASPQLVRRAAASEAQGDGIADLIETDPGTYFAGVAAEPAPAQAPAAGWNEESSVSVAPVGNQDPGLRGLWRTITPDRGTATGGLPLVPGFAVVRMRVQPGDGGAEVVAVDQQLDTGELIRTISGPAQRVAALVNADGAEDAAGRVTVTIRQADRMVAVTGPSDVLGSLLSRVNARRRY